MLQIIKYGNTKTYYINNSFGGLLVDTDWAGTLPAFFGAIKEQNISLADIKYLMITHYHHITGMPKYSLGQAATLPKSDIPIFWRCADRGWFLTSGMERAKSVRR